MLGSQQNPESLVKRLRALADKRQKEATKERKVIAQTLMGAAHGYRQLADALERQPTLPWIKSSSSHGTDEPDVQSAEIESGDVRDRSSDTDRS
ncbi:MAG TPA: hypothetical protein VM867_03240 [Xanthobacteraceae bacterium]|nr:hypothetical protein [Xanthobacteraceae bacterium]